MLEPLAPGVRQLKNDTNAKKDEQIEKACRDFEAILVATLMKDSARQIGSLDRSQKEKPFGSLEDTAWEMTARALSGEGEGIGLWKALYDSITSQDTGR